jgi:Uncharacterized membrane protein, possible Na+ channel or pump
MIGTLLNVAGILIGGTVGIFRRSPLPLINESFLKVALGAFTVYYGLRLSWLSLNGSFPHILKQILIAILALMLGKLSGRLFGLQKFSNSLGRAARERIASITSQSRRDPGVGFKTCAVLFCATPLAILGSMQDGLSGYYYPLAVKGVIEGFGALGFASIMGWGTLLAALPVLVFQGSITLICERWLAPFISSRHLQYLLDETNVVGGLLVFCVGLIIFELKKLEVADYLPSLIYAPLLAWIW